MENDLRLHLGIIAEWKAKLALATMDLKVEPTPHKAPQDLLVNDILTVEVKAANRTRTKHSSGRFQFNIRQAADIFILYCFGPHPATFIIPGRLVKGLRQIAIYSKNPNAYAGKWSRFRDAWYHVENELAKWQQQ